MGGEESIQSSGISDGVDGLGGARKRP